MTDYKPMMSDERAKRIRKWHEDNVKESNDRGTVTVTVLDRKFIVPPEVFDPKPMSLLGKAILREVKESDRVLDMGTGSGINGILAASKSTNVVAVDVNPAAVECAKRNAELNGVASRIDVRDSDLFQNVEGKFDLILFDPPFRWFKPRDMRERGTADENYQTLTAFLHEVKQYLNPDGRILLNFGTSGDIDYLYHLINEAGFDKEVVEQAELVKDDWKVEYFAFKLTDNSSQ